MIQWNFSTVQGLFSCKFETPPIDRVQYQSRVPFVVLLLSIQYRAKYWDILANAVVPFVARMLAEVTRRTNAIPFTDLFSQISDLRMIHWFLISLSPDQRTNICGNHADLLKISVRLILVWKTKVCTASNMWEVGEPRFVTFLPTRNSGFLVYHRRNDTTFIFIE